jgi:hypothetical protein
MKSILYGLVFTGLIATTVTYALVRQTAANTAPGAAAQKRVGRKAIRGTASPQVQQYDTLAALAADSQHIIIGVPTYRAGHINSPSDNLVFTDYRVRVQSVLKGGLKEGDLAWVRTLGGSVELPDGTQVTTEVPDFWKSPVAGEGYILFLTKQNESRFYKLTGGPQGLFLIPHWGNQGADVLSTSAAHTVVPQVRPSDKLMKRYEQMSTANFLKELRRAIGTDAGGR